MCVARAVSRRGLNITQYWNCFTARATVLHLPTIFVTPLPLTNCTYLVTQPSWQYNIVLIRTAFFSFNNNYYILYIYKKICCILYSSTFISIVSFYLFWLRRNSIKCVNKLIGTTLFREFENVKCLNVYIMQGG